MIKYPKTYGCCAGAKRAIDMALKLRDDNPNKNIYIYKEILHNKYIIDYLEKRNIFCIDDLSLVKKDDILIIRAHGEALSTYEYLDKNNIKYYDATCLNVKKVHDIISLKYKEGYKIVIVGKKNHPEVIGTNGHVDNSTIIIENKDDYTLLNKNDKLYIVCQTTIEDAKFNDLISYLSENDYTFEYKNTICKNQELIHTSSIKLAKEADMMIVIGGNNSSNTKVLYDKCLAVNKETYLFSSLNDFYKFIKKSNITSKTNIGITGGASTSHYEIEEYSKLLEFLIYYKAQVKNFNEEINEFNKTLINKKDNKIIIDALNKFININCDGKFLRACLIDLGYKLSGKCDKEAHALAIAYETFQTSVLVHDDIIDNADTRRGKSTLHHLYEEEFISFKDKDNTPTSLALCIGDIGFYYANKLIIDKYKNYKNFASLFDYYNDIVINTIKGEILDVYIPYKEKNDKNNILKEEDIMEIYRLKTAYYSVVGPFILGMILSDRNENEIEEIKSILMEIGIAFQIKDDILGIFSTSTTLGKPVLSDAKEFKQTILYSYIKENKKDYYNELIKYYGKKDLGDEEIKKIKDIMIESGSLKYASCKMEKALSNGKEKIKALNINENVKNILLGLIIYLQIREK